MAQKYKDFALALSGGGARGLVHAGLLHALEEEGLKAAAVSGASMGAIVGALYCSGMPPKDMLDVIKLPGFFSLASWISLQGGLGSLAVLHQQLEKYIPEDSFESLQIPLTVSVTNLNTGLNELYSSGSLFDKIEASASIPVIFAPVKIGEHYYVDGGLTLNMPLSCLKKRGRLIVGSNSNYIAETDMVFDSMKQIAERTLFLTVENTLHTELKHCDLCFVPKATTSYATFDFDHASDIFEIGYKEGKKFVPEILAKLI